MDTDGGCRVVIFDVNRFLFWEGSSPDAYMLICVKNTYDVVWKAIESSMRAAKAKPPTKYERNKRNREFSNIGVAA